MYITYTLGGGCDTAVVPISKPFFRTVRPFADFGAGRAPGGGETWGFGDHPDFAQGTDAENLYRSAQLLGAAVSEVFNVIEPADAHRDVYSLTLHQLLVRACIEVEANLRGILAAHGYSKVLRDERLSMVDYWRVDRSHLLSAYEVHLWRWSGELAIRRPFDAWYGQTEYQPLAWYQAYNAVKHNRADIHRATLGNLVDACCGLAVLVTTQFDATTFDPGPTLLAWGEFPRDGFKKAGGLGFTRLRVIDGRAPDDERYWFDWRELSATDEPFQRFDFDAE